MCLPMQSVNKLRGSESLPGPLHQERVILIEETGGAELKWSLANYKPNRTKTRYVSSSNDAFTGINYISIVE